MSLLKRRLAAILAMQMILAQGIIALQAMEQEGEDTSTKIEEVLSAGENKQTTGSSISAFQKQSAQGIDIAKQEVSGDMLLGSGEVNDPYQITTSSQLHFIGEYPDAHFILQDNIDFEEWETLEGFRGSLDGNGKSIINLKQPLFEKMEAGAVVKELVVVGLEQPLFMDIYSEASVQNIVLEDVKIELERENAIGAIARWNAGEIKGCKVYGKIDVKGIESEEGVEGGWAVGGITGLNYGQIMDCEVLAEISGIDFVGGVVGADWGEGQISNCSVEGSVNGIYGVGGIVGESNSGSIIGCTAAINVKGDWAVGGLVGLNGPDGMIEQCEVEGEVIADGEVGGIAGRNAGDIIDSQVSNIRVSSGGWNVGGIVGSNVPYELIQEEELPKVEGVKLLSNVEIKGLTNVGGVAGRSLGVVEGAEVYEAIIIGERVPEIEYSGMRVGGVVGFNCGDMDEVEGLAGIVKTSSVEDGVVVKGIDAVGGVVGENPGEIKECNVKGVQVIGINGVGGIAGGNVNWDDETKLATISNTTSQANVNGDNEVGGIVGFNRGEVENSIAFNSYIEGVHAVGGAIGCNEGIAYSLEASALVKGESYTGGVIGNNTWEGAVQGSMFTGLIEGADHIGGVVGFNEGDISECYSSGIVEGHWGIGGVVGENRGSIQSSYTSTQVIGEYEVGGVVGYYEEGVVQKAYFDLTLNPELDNGVGLTTEELTSGTDIGLGSAWQFEQGYYPRLNVQSAIQDIAVTPLHMFDGVNAYDSIVKDAQLVGVDYMGGSLAWNVVEDKSAPKDGYAQLGGSTIYVTDLDEEEVYPMWLQASNVSAFKPVIYTLGTGTMPVLEGITLQTGVIYTADGESDQGTMKMSGGIDVSSEDIRWYSDNPQVASVDEESGVITAKAGGVATIIAKVEGYEKIDISAEVKVEEYAPYHTIELVSSEEETLYKNKTKQIEVQVEEVGSRDYLDWASSDERIVEVDENGVIKAKRKGTATITATSHYNDEVQAIEVEVTVKERSYDEWEAPAGGVQKEEPIVEEGIDDLDEATLERREETTAWVKERVDEIEGATEERREELIAELVNEMPYIYSEEELSEESRKMLEGIGVDVVTISASDRELGEEVIVDVDENHWASGAIDALCSGGYLNGLESEVEDVSDELSMKATSVILARYFMGRGGVDVQNDRNTVGLYFETDETALSYETAYLLSALSVDTMKAASEAGDEGISRGLLAQILYELTGGAMERTEEAKEYQDTVDNEYYEALVYCQQVGLLNGINDEEMAPDKSVTLAELAMILQRLE